jgi:hypothetical protein
VQLSLPQMSNKMYRYEIWGHKNEEQCFREQSLVEVEPTEGYLHEGAIYRYTLNINFKTINQKLTTPDMFTHIRNRYQLYNSVDARIYSKQLLKPP